jgi:hypothetical protein
MQAPPIKILRRDMPSFVVVGLLMGSSPLLCGMLYIKKRSFNQNISENDALSSDSVHSDSGHVTLERVCVDLFDLRGR